MVEAPPTSVPMMPPATSKLPERLPAREKSPEVRTAREVFTAMAIMMTMVARNVVIKAGEAIFTGFLPGGWLQRLPLFSS